MRLKKIVIVGFKSFAEKTTLYFEKGITGIVGPNGCGKSNIADAFRWVLGEQSAKSLRGHKMPDVIFAGASQRQSLNFAEVSLTLTDIQGALPIDYEEVTITRRLHRSGESEYFLNSNPVRLKDIHSLLLDSGIGKNAFSIFEQGKIDQVINYSPVERRFIFEEAAGITRFLARKQEAVKRLEQADLNLSRVQDIHLEVEKTIQLLQNQAEKALLFKENQNRLETLMKAAVVLRWQANARKQDDLKARFCAFQTEWQEAADCCSVKSERIKEVKDLLAKNEKKRHDSQQKFFEYRSQAEIQKNELQTNQQRALEFNRKLSKLKQELEDLFLTQKTRQQTLKNIQSKRQEVESTLDDFASKMNYQGSKVKQKEEEVFQLRQETQSCQQAFLKFVQQESALANEVKQLEFRRENNQERSKILLQKIEQLQQEMAQAVNSIHDKKAHLQKCSGIIDAYKDRLDQFEERLSQLNLKVDAEKKEFENTRKKSMELKARHQVLLKMQEEFEGFSVGSKKLMQQSMNKQSPLHMLLQPLYEFFRPHSDVAHALSSVLRIYSQTLVVKTEEDLKKVLKFAEDNNIQDFSLVCLESIEKMPKPASAGKSSSNLLEKVERNAIVEHFLQEVEIWETTEEALSQPVLKEGWSAQGGYIDQRGVFFRSRLSENQVFLREAELVTLSTEIASDESQLQKLERVLNQMQQEKSAIQSERMEVDQQLRREEMKLIEVNYALQRALGDQEKGKSQQQTFEKELQELQTQIECNQTELQAAQNRHFTVRQELVKVKEKLATYEQELTVQEQALNIQQQDAKEKVHTYQEMLENKRKLHQECQLLESKEQSHDDQVARIAEERQEIEEQQHLLQERNLKLTAALEELEKQLEASQAQCQSLEQEAQSLKALSTQIEKEELDLRTNVQQLEMQMAHLKTQEEHVQQLNQALQEEVREKYALEMGDLIASHLPVDKSLEQMEKEMRRLRQVLQEAGNVNLMAIEELETHRERYHFLNQQITDLTQTKQELTQLMMQLDAESRRLLRETFEIVRGNFQKNFGILFNGGEADLQFTGEANNILESGIEISAKPPGKQMRSISLLSGGEKCLTAVALLFAIFEVKPSPFCILDEIDAPLDDTNIDRFVNVVRHFADRCQFLIITHNKRTMAIADVLFGVSMEEKGVSKLLSLEFSSETSVAPVLI